MRWTLLACLLVGAGCVEPSGVGRASQAIVGGTDDSGDPAMVALVVRRQLCEDPEVLPFCSGILISPRVVLTAAHCIADSPFTRGVEVFFGNDTLADPQGRFIVATKTQIHPSYDRSSKDFDMALLQLAEPAQATPVPPATTALDASAVGTTVRAVGFGVTSSGSAQPDGRKRQGNMMVSSLAQVTFQTAPGPAMTCAGDSGAPVLAMLGGVEQLVGVTSAGDPSCSSFAINARVDQFVGDFIQPFVDAAANAPVGTVDGPIPAEQICSMSCTSDDDCPASIGCSMTMSGGQCFSTSAGAGNWGADCSTNADCPAAGTVCGRLKPDSCRCFSPCMMLPPPPKEKMGCSSVPGNVSGAPALLVLMLCAVLALARRQR